MDSQLPLQLYGDALEYRKSRAFWASLDKMKFIGNIENDIDFHFR